MQKPLRNLSSVVLLVMSLSLLVTGTTAWAWDGGRSSDRLKVGMILTLEGEDAASNLYEQTFRVSGGALLPFTEKKFFQILEIDGEDDMLLARWDRHGNLYAYRSGSEFTAFLNGPVGAIFQYEDIEGTVVAVGETVVVAAGIFEDCVLVEKHNVGGSVPSPPWFEWWKPGLFFVKWIDWNVSDNEPVEWELMSIEYNRPY